MRIMNRKIEKKCLYCNICIISILIEREGEKGEEREEIREWEGMAQSEK